MRNPLLAAAILAGLTACGGGGGGSSPPPPPAATFNASAALATALSTGYSAPTLSATVGGVPYQAALSFAPLPDGVLLGANMHRSTQTVTLFKSGATVSVGSATLYFQQAARLAAAVDSTSLFTVYKPVSDIPTAGTIGQSGTYSTGTVYVDTTNSTQLATTTSVWSIEPDSGSTALACLATTTTSTGSTTTKTCLRINAAGQIQGAVVTLPVGSTQAVFQ